MFGPFCAPPRATRAEFLDTPGGAEGGLGSQWYNTDKGRNHRLVIVSGQSLGMGTDGHSALLGAANFNYYANAAAFHMNCGNPDSGVTDTTFGEINSQPGTPRRLMIAAKLIF